jgi:ribosomal RNA-processing protein 9
MDCWMRNKPITVSGDRTARVWNVDEESHALYRSNLTAIESVQYTGEDSFATGGQNGAISLWHSNLKKPVVTVESAHGIEKLSPRWICSLASNKVSDVLVSGSFDGFIKLWKIGGERRNVLTSMVNIPATGFVNSIAISSKLLVAGMGKEHKYGRWWNLKEAKNQIIILKLPHIND